jgi:hypothetical protein
MQTQEANISKGDQLRAFFTENPDAATVAAAKQFDCSPGHVSAIKKEMGIARPYLGMKRKKPVKKLVKKVKPATHTNGTFKNGSGWSEGLVTTFVKEPQNDQRVFPATWLEVSIPEVTATPPPSLSPWADYGLWMDRDSLKGYLRGRAVEYLTKGDKLSVEEALRCVTKLSELTD